MAFYIEQLIVSGPGKNESVINFQNGVNIICGPSNTGKTYVIKCIDYMFGGSEFPIDYETGYDTVKLILNSPQGQVILSRKLDKTKFSVKSSHPDIPTGEYLVKGPKEKYNQTIASVWLSLIGINSMHQINANGKRRKQLLTWRTFCHMFLLTEQRMISLNSALLPESSYSGTAALSAIIFLLSGNDFSDEQTQESKEVRDAKKTAIKKYINDELFVIADRMQDVNTQLGVFRDINIHQEIDTITNRIEYTERQISAAMQEDQEILACLHQENESLAECTLLLERYEMLATQYASDMERLSFIVDGELNIGEKTVSKCPFCDGHVIISQNENYIEAAKTEYAQIKAQANDLDDAYIELISEQAKIRKKVEELSGRKHAIESIIDNKLKPELVSLKESLAQYKKAIELESEMAFLKGFVEQKTSDIIMIETTTDDTIAQFNPKEYFDYNLIMELCEKLTHTLQKCKYPNLSSVTFEKTTMDIVVNGKKKKSNGKGYAAYLNTVVALVFAQYMKEHAKYYPGVVVLDSPILSLKEKENQQPSDSMRTALFEYIVKNEASLQTIIAENEIPDIDYTGANIIEFTKINNNGRYGFLVDVTE